MVTEQDKIYVQQAKATVDKSVMIDRICRLLYAILGMWLGWLLYSDSATSGNLMRLLPFFPIVHCIRMSEGVDTSHYQELVAFLEAKLAEAEVGTEKDNYLNADQSAEQAGQIPI